MSSTEQIKNRNLTDNEIEIIKKAIQRKMMFTSLSQNDSLIKSELPNILNQIESKELVTLFEISSYYVYLRSVMSEYHGYLTDGFKDAFTEIEKEKLRPDLYCCRSLRSDLKAAFDLILTT